jgi:hypothetical protein
MFVYRMCVAGATPSSKKMTKGFCLKLWHMHVQLHSPTSCLLASGRACTLVTLVTKPPHLCHSRPYQQRRHHEPRQQQTK